MAGSSRIEQDKKGQQAREQRGGSTGKPEVEGSEKGSRNGARRCIARRRRDPGGEHESKSGDKTDNTKKRLIERRVRGGHPVTKGEGATVDDEGQSTSAG